MSIRTDIAALILEGHTDTHIAHRLGCHRITVNRARHALQRPFTEKERLLSEELPTGRVREYDRRRQPTSASQAAANRRALEDAIRSNRQRSAA